MAQGSASHHYTGRENKVWLATLAHVTLLFCLLSFFFHLESSVPTQTGKQRVGGAKGQKVIDLNLNSLAWSAVFPHYNQEILEWPQPARAHLERQRREGGEGEEGGVRVARKGGAPFSCLGSNWIFVSLVHIFAYIHINVGTFNLWHTFSLWDSVVFIISFLTRGIWLHLQIKFVGFQIQPRWSTFYLVML